MNRLLRLHDQPERIVAGCMSGTSLDGVDAVIARLRGSGPGMSIEVLAFVHHPYAPEVQRLLLDNSEPTTSSVRDLSQLNVRLAYVYAEAIDAALDAARLGRADLDLVGSHGQTVHHVPDDTPCAGQAVRSTLQLGSPSTLAQHLGVPVVGDFRLADMVHGGQGAPLVPYFDYVYFSDSSETRLLLNLGGIANVTVLPAGGTVDDLVAFDTGPANMVVNALAQHLYDVPYDEGGALAAAGTVDNNLLSDLLSASYFQQPPPKSTGREQFGTAYVQEVLHGAQSGLLRDGDIMATATMLTAASVYQAYARFIRTEYDLDVVIASGGGVHNRTLMQNLADVFAPIPVRTVDDYGLDADAKEALCFAVLAHETINGVPSNVPSATGASQPAVLGVIGLPS